MTDDIVVDAGNRAAPASWHPEIEIKLVATERATGRLLRQPPLAFAADSGEKHLESIYFDTADRRLQEKGVTLRVRRKDGTHVQTVKTEATGHAEARLERDDPIDGPAPRAALLREAAGKGIGPIGDGDLEPVFASRIDRRTLVVSSAQGTGQSVIEVAIDCGVIEAGSGSTPVREIELELVEGSIGDLYDLALALHRLAPLAVEPRTKSQRGYRLAGGSAPRGRKAAALELGAEATLDEGIARVMNHCHDHWLRNQAAVLDGRDIEGVHQMRVALRRLRAAFDFFRPWIPEAQRSWFRREIRWIAGHLGAARDLDVLHVDTLAPVRKAFPDDADLGLLDDLVCARRAAAYRALANAMASPRYAGVVLAMGQWIARGGWRTERGGAAERPLTAETSGALDAVHELVMTRGANFETLDNAARHDLRLAIKRLRYAMQFVGSAHGGAGPAQQMLSRLQDALGAANDAALAEQQIARCLAGVKGERRLRQLARTRGLVTGWWTAQGSSREKRTLALWREFAGLAPFWRGTPALHVVDR